MRTLPTLILCGLMTLPALATEKTAVKRLESATHVLAASIKAPDRGIPKELLQRAECVGVFPDVTKAAFVVGGEFGKGLITCRERSGSMGAPAFFRIGAGSVGWQIGANEADLVLLVMNDDGVGHLLQDHVALGGEVSAVAGPVGRTAQAATDAQMHAQILSWSRSRGLFLGASLEGAVIAQDKDTNESFYGKPVSAKELLVDHALPPPPSARAFLDLANSYAKR